MCDKMKLSCVLILTVCFLWTLAEAQDYAGNVQNKTDEAIRDEDGDRSKATIIAGLQRRLVTGNSPSRRDSQLLSLLAARRRQLISERVGAHLATIATFAHKPERHNVTNAQLEIRDSNNSVIKRISLPDGRAVPIEKRSDLRPVVTKLIPSDSRSSEIRTTVQPKFLQDPKTLRPGFLNRRKPASEVVRFGQSTKKPLIDLSVVSHETLGIPEHKKDIDGKTDEDGDLVLDSDEEFQVDESNHGVYLYNYTTNSTSALNENYTISTPLSEVNVLNVTISTKPSLVEEAAKLVADSKVVESRNKNDTSNATKVGDEIKEKPTKEELPHSTTKPKVEPTSAKENENNTLFLSDELYNHFRPLESELPAEDMAPFLFFGQKITMGIPKDNITQLQLSPTKPTYHIRQPDKKRGSYRPVTEKVVSEEIEDEINENMDVSVVKNVIEKNKIRTTAKMQAPSRHGNLVNAYRKQQLFNSTATPIISTTEPTTAESQVKELNVTKEVDEQLNKTVALTNVTRGTNRTYNFRRKPAKLTLNSSDVETLTTTPLPSTVVYTAVVTSVSITSSVKAQNKTETNVPLPAEKVESDTNTDTKEDSAPSDDLTTVESVNGILEKLNNISNDSDSRKKNETIIKNVNRKKQETRQRLSTNRPRIRFTPPGKQFADNSNTNLPSPTPFILFSNKSRIPQSALTNKYRNFTPNERSVQKYPNNNQTTTLPTVQTERSSTALPIVMNNPASKICHDDPQCDDIAKRIVYPSEIVNAHKALNVSEKLTDYDNPIVTTVAPLNVTNKAVEKTTDSLPLETVKIENPVTISSKTKNVKNKNEVLERRNNEVLIEMEKSNMTTYVLAGLGFLPLTIIVLFVLRHLFMKKTKDIDTDYEGYFQDDMKKETQITTVARAPLPSPKKPDQKLEFPRNKLRLQTLLGQGNFGQVWKAEADDLTGHDGLTRLVAVKTIKETASQKEKQELLHEICIMQKIGTHPNVVTLLGCCTEQEPYLLIMEYVMCGKLLTYLRDRRSRVDRFQMSRGGLTSRDLTVFAYCVARGMDYLASKGIVHRDLAARNVLVDHNKLCKIADFGMSREVSATDDKLAKPQRNALPVRWMAPEALLYSVYSHETDVWAYGVLLWEIVTLGSTPYATMSGREVLHMVTEGYRLERPAHCKPHLYQTMHACWHADPSQRPPFSEIKRQLCELLENEPTEGNYVDLDSFYQDSSVYSDPSAIIENDGGISIEYSDELGSKIKNDIPSFHIPNATNQQRNFSGGNSLNNNNFRNDNFNTVRAGNHTTVGGFGIMDGGFSGRDGNFIDRNNKEKLSGASFHRERENNVSRENGHPGNGLISRNSFNGVTNANWSGHTIRPFLVKSGSSRSKRISEFECNI